MKIILSGKIKDLFNKKVLNPDWWNAVGAGWELGKGIAAQDSPRSKKMRTLQEFLRQNPGYADKYYGRSQSGLSHEQIESILSIINWENFPSLTREKVYELLRQPGGYQFLVQLGVIPNISNNINKKRKTPQTTFQETETDVIPENTFVEPVGEENLPY